MRCVDLEWEMGDLTLYSCIYLKPPTALAIVGVQALLADDFEPLIKNINTASDASMVAAQEPLTTNQEMVMFDYFVPAQLSVEPPALIAAAGASQPKLTKPRTMCWDIGSDQPDSALNSFDILKSDDLKKYAQTVASKFNYQVTLLEAPTHGKVGPDGMWNLTVGVPAQMGSSSVNYRPAQDYVGKDRAVFLVDVYNKQYKVTVNFWVTPVVYDLPQGDTFCRSQKFGLTDGLPSYMSSWMQSADLSTFLAAASSVSYTFSDFPSTALGQTTGEGATATITLDTNAAGHNWYIAPTPLDNSDDYLPTSDPTARRLGSGLAIIQIPSKHAAIRGMANPMTFLIPQSGILLA